MEQSGFIVFLSSHQWIIPVAIVWTLFWKGIALWKAARNRSPAWFVAILILNTLGILEIVYILIFSKKNAEVEEKKEDKEPTEKKIV